MSQKKSSTAAAPTATEPKIPTESPIDTQQLKSCLVALYAHLQQSAQQSSTKQLFDADSEEIQLQIALKKIPHKGQNNPIAIPIPHSLYDPANHPGSEICLFTKDPPAQSEEDAANGVPAENPIKTKLMANPVAGITKVLSISKLRKNYHQFADRRRLLDGYSFFLTDDRITPLLPALLGTKFFEKKKQPVPVRISGADMQKELTKARDSTYMYISTGASLTVRISRSSFSRADTLANIQAALPIIAAHIPKKWAGIQSIHIKSQNSIALPIYNSFASLEPLIPDPEPVKKSASSKKSKKELKKKKASSKKKAAVAAAAASGKTATTADGSVKKKGVKRALSTKKEETKSEDKTSKKQKTETPAATVATPKKTAPTTPAKAPVAVAPATSTKPTPAKRARDESAPSSTATSASTSSPAPSAKKAKSAPTPAPAPVAATPAKAAKSSTTPTAKSAVKAAATPAPKASQKKAPATVASKKK